MKTIKLIGFAILMTVATYVAYLNFKHQLEGIKIEYILQQRRNKIDSLRMLEFNNIKPIEQHDSTLLNNMVEPIEQDENNELNNMEQ